MGITTSCKTHPSGPPEQRGQRGVSEGVSTFKEQVDTPNLVELAK